MLHAFSFYFVGVVVRFRYVCVAPRNNEEGDDYEEIIITTNNNKKSSSSNIGSSNNSSNSNSKGKGSSKKEGTGRDRSGSASGTTPDPDEMEGPSTSKGGSGGKSKRVRRPKDSVKREGGSKKESGVRQAAVAAEDMDVDCPCGVERETQVRLICKTCVVAASSFSYSIYIFATSR